ncbi:hypothetical protein LIER_11746 [Lithospermum erythrorhizon]|uniref:Pentatricopeptide repeat-containing protein n=1 Tax=Lithospermum erythrorhizon TaxID=34254 RepID=A0AAV3PT69_LITER
MSTRRQLKSMCTLTQKNSYIFQQNLKITQLGKKGKINEAKKIFNQISKPNIVTYNSMISAYSKNGRFLDARKVFDTMPHRNPVSWNAMISAYLNNDQCGEAIKLFDQMVHKDSYTYALMITCYTRVGLFDKARMVFDAMPDKGNVACWNAMVSGYVKNGKLKEAGKLFYVMPVKNLVSWNTMLSGYIQNREMLVALKFFTEMEEKDAVSWNLMVDGYVEVGDLESAWELFKKIPEANAVSWVTMLSGYAKHDRVLEARRVFDQMPDKTPVAWNAMLAAYAQNCQINEAIRLFIEMPERTDVAWTTMINGYIRVGRFEEAQKLLNSMPYKSVGAQTAMISGLIQNNQMDEAKRAFDIIRTPDLICWNTMIAGYTRYGRMEEASDMFQQMPQKNTVTWNLMIAGYAQVGQIDKATNLFEQMSERNLVSWNSLISGYLQNGFYTDALKCFELMKRENKKPDQATYASILSSCANLAVEQTGKQLHQNVLKTGFVKKLLVGNALITMYAKCGCILSAQNMFNEIDNIDLVSWNSLIAGYALNGYGNEAIKLLNDMDREGVQPDQVTFIGILSACNHAGLVDQGRFLFEQMTHKYSLDPLTEHLSCIIDLLARAGRLDEAFQLANEMKNKLHAGIWGSLLNACCQHKNAALAGYAAEKLVQCEPQESSPFVLLSNMSAEIGKWDEVNKLRAMLRQSGTGKQPGCSWIEDKNRLLVFLSGDDACPHKVEVFSTSKALNLHITDGNCCSGRSIISGRDETIDMV